MSKINDQDAQYNAIDIALYLCRKSGWSLSRFTGTKSLVFCPKCSIWGRQAHLYLRKIFRRGKHGPVLSTVYNGLKSNEANYITQHGFPSHAKEVDIDILIRSKNL